MEIENRMFKIGNQAIIEKDIKQSRVARWLYSEGQETIEPVRKCRSFPEIKPPVGFLELPDASERRLHNVGLTERIVREWQTAIINGQVPDIGKNGNFKEFTTFDDFFEYFDRIWTSRS